MTTLFYKFKLSRHSGFPPPLVIAAVDVNANNSGDTDEYIADLKWSELVCTGTKKVDVPSDGLLVMTAFSANLGAKVTLEVKETNDEGRVLHSSDFIVCRSPDTVSILLRG